MGGLLSGGLEHFLCSIIYGMSSFPLTHIFQDGYCTTNQLKISGESRSIHLVDRFCPNFLAQKLVASDTQSSVTHPS